MRKFLYIALALLLSMSALAGCARSVADEAAKGSGLSVVATIFPPYDFARAVAGGNAEVFMLLPPAAESHSFEPTPQDIIKIQDCDVFIYVGGKSDQWINGVLAAVDTSKMKIVTLMDCVDAVEEEITPGMEEEESEGDAEGAGLEYDEHVWTSPRNAKLIVQKISDAICEADAANAGVYERNTTSYLGQLDELDGKFRAAVADAARSVIVFADRFPFRYLADAYGLTYFAAFPGCSAETEPSAATVKFLIDKINAEKIPAVFHLELSSKKMAEAISESTGAKVLRLHSCHNISKQDFQAGKTYLSIMTENVGALKEGLE